jgi:hypothetical protein
MCAQAGAESVSPTVATPRQLSHDPSGERRLDAVRKHHKGTAFLLRLPHGRMLTRTLATGRQA